MGRDRATPRKVLLVDDDATVLELAALVLRRAGFEVVKASSAKEALEVFSSRPGEIDLLVSDIVMPGMSGDQLAERLVQQKPRLRYVLMSGNPPGSLELRIPVEEGANFLRKPFTIEEMRAVVSQQAQLAAV